MSKETLLLNNTWEVLSFISHRKVLKLLVKDKVEVVSTWDDEIVWVNGKLKYPSILRLKKYVKRNFIKSDFNRRALLNRDLHCCQYCGVKLTQSQITIDHILPKAQKGTTSFTNCVVCCQLCNGKKADRTPEQAEMVLLKKPIRPSFFSYNYFVNPKEHWFPGWSDFISNIYE